MTTPAAAGEQIYADDFTRLFTHQSRQFTAGDVSLRAVGGVQWNAAGPALLAAAAAAALLAVPLLLTRASPWLAAIPVAVELCAALLLHRTDPRPAAAAPPVLVAAGTAAAQLSGLSPWWALPAAAAAFVAVYLRLARDRVAGLTELQRARLAWHFRTRQPRLVLGLTADTEPGAFTWRVITWAPPGQESRG